MVEYTNGAVSTPTRKWRAQNGHPTPYHVKLWGIGNEPWGDYQMDAIAIPQFELKHNIFADATKLHNILDNYGIANSFEIYSGTHTSAAPIDSRTCPALFQ